MNELAEIPEMVSGCRISSMCNITPPLKDGLLLPLFKPPLPIQNKYKLPGQTQNLHLLITYRNIQIHPPIPQHLRSRPRKGPLHPLLRQAPLKLDIQRHGVIKQRLVQRLAQRIRYRSRDPRVFSRPGGRDGVVPVVIVEPARAQQRVGQRGEVVHHHGQVRRVHALGAREPVPHVAAAFGRPVTRR